jgi:hypothetical protein
MRESDTRESDIIHKIADFMRKVLPDATTSQNKRKPPTEEPKFEAIDLGTPTTQPSTQAAVATQTEHAATKTHNVAIISTSSATEVFETPKKTRLASSDDVVAANDDDDDDGDEADEYETNNQDIRAFGRRNFGVIASPYLTPYVYNRLFLDKHTISEETATSF